jgi:hypothetical protein
MVTIFLVVGWSGASEASDAINLLYSGQILLLYCIVVLYSNNSGRG